MLNWWGATAVSKVAKIARYNSTAEIAPLAGFEAHARSGHETSQWIGWALRQAAKRSSAGALSIARASISASVNSPAQYCFSIEVIFNHFALAARSTDG